MGKLINFSFYSPKTTFLAIFANFGPLWMVVKNFEIDPIFAKESYQEKHKCYISPQNIINSLKKTLLLTSNHEK